MTETSRAALAASIWFRMALALLGLEFQQKRRRGFLIEVRQLDRGRVGLYLGIERDQAALGFVDELIAPLKPLLIFGSFRFQSRGALFELPFQMLKLRLFMQEARIQRGILNVLAIGIDRRRSFR